ncbi:hypothetical protein ACVBEH_33295, partial [Roseateles sp. GG27B]
LAAGFSGLVPLPFHSVHQAVVWVPDEAIVRAESSGQVVRALVQPGAPVVAGDTLLVLENPVLSADVGVAAAGL